MIGHQENLKCQSDLCFIVLFLPMFISASDLNLLLLCGAFNKINYFVQSIYVWY